MQDDCNAMMEQVKKHGLRPTENNHERHYLCEEKSWVKHINLAK